MSAGAAACATLAAIASSPEAVAESPAHLVAAIDALVDVYMHAQPAGLNARQAALRSPRATWCTVLSHAEHRAKQVNAAAAAKGGTA